jgi:hypothetical protein
MLPNKTEKFLSLISKETKRVIEPIEPIMDKTNQCSECGKFYKDDDVAVLDDKVFCFNCIDLAEPYWRIRLLRNGFTTKNIDKLLILQYGLTVRPVQSWR